MSTFIDDDQSYTLFGGTSMACPVRLTDSSRQGPAGSGQRATTPPPSNAVCGLAFPSLGDILLAPAMHALRACSACAPASSVTMLPAVNWLQIVSGAAALIWSAMPTANYSTVRSRQPGWVVVAAVLGPRLGLEAGGSAMLAECGTRRAEPACLQQRAKSALLPGPSARKSHTGPAAA